MAVLLVFPFTGGVQKRPNGFRGEAKTWVVLDYHETADQRNYLPLNALTTKNFVQHSLEHCANLTLGHRHTYIQQVLGSLRRSVLLLDQKVVDLWAVAVCDYYLVARAKQGHRMAASQFHAAHLLRDIARIAIRENGVATPRNDISLVVTRFRCSRRHEFTLPSSWIDAQVESQQLGY